MAQSVNDLQEIPRRCSTVVELLRYQALHQPEREAFTFLEDGETQSTTLTYRELDRYSRAIASQLQSLGLSGERAVLLYPSGLDYLAAFFGCLYAGVVAVPAYPPRNQRNTPRILSVLADSEAKVILTTTAVFSQLQSLLRDRIDTPFFQWLTTDNLPPGIETAWKEPFIERDTLAFLQYTSGSTGTPKGVILSHGNLLHNAATTYHFMEHSSSSKFVSWLPIYHDMGLVGGVLQPLYGGFPCIMMPPQAFLQRPYRWLQAISYYQGTTSGAPNFAYELCIEKITAEQRSTLDLSSWSVAFNGAEPIHQHTLERFSQTFAECGFRSEYFYPCYGMAEATLMVTGSVKAALPTTKTLQKTALECNQVIDANLDEENSITLVSSGRAIPDQQIVIVNPETLKCCQSNEIGEIWVCGLSIGHGYWNNVEATEQTFHAYTQDTGIGPFLRTGDLGFLHNDELFITGRAKDLIIIRGRNLYPQDIELTAENSHPTLRVTGGAAFAVEVDNEERLVIVHELEFRAKPNLEEVIDAIREKVSQEHEVQVYAVVLIKPGSIPKTSSGKIQRRATKAEFLAGTLNVLKSSILESSHFSESIVSLSRKSLLELAPEQRYSQLILYLQQQVVRVLQGASLNINLQQSLSTFGIDSLMAFDLKNQIQQDLEVSVSAVELFDENLEKLAKQVLTQIVDTVPTHQKLQPVPRNLELPLCLTQERLWFLDQLEPGNPFYNVAIAIRLTGTLHIEALQQSLNEMVKRHETLRTSFTVVEERPIQIIHPKVGVELSIVDIKNYYLPDPEENKIQSIILEETQKPFNLSQAPLLRTKLLCLQPQEHLLLVTMHHIISDGWSMRVFIQELTALYQAFSTQKPLPLSNLVIQYADFAYWQRQWLQGEILQTQIDYWQQQLKGNLPVLQLTKTRPPVQTFTGKKYPLALPKELTTAVKNLNQKEGVTLFMTLLAVFKSLLYCYTNQEDILVGSPVVGRNWAETENLIGFFINTLVFRTNLSSNLSFQELLVRVRQVALGAYAHQDVPFEKLVEELQPERNLSYNPLFQVMFILQNTQIPSVELPSLTWEPQEVDSGTSKFDLKLSLWESLEGLRGSIEYKTDLFDEMTISRMASHFELLLARVVQQPEIKLKELASLVMEADKKQDLLQAKELECISLQKLKLIKRVTAKISDQ